MFVSARTLIYWALVIVFYTAFQGGKYYMNNRIQELGLLLTIVLLFYSALLAALNVKARDLNWSGWILGTLLFIGYTFILPGYLFSQHAGVAMWPSVFASREFLIMLLAPAIYFLCRIGYRLEDIESAFYMAMFVLLFSYLFFRFTMPLESMFNSDNYAIKGLVTYDEGRGYRLRPPWTAFIFLSVIAPIQWYRSTGNAKHWWLLITLLIMWAILMQGGRSAMAAIVLGVMAYNVFFATRARMGLFFLALPLIVTGMAAMTYFLLKELSEAPIEGDGVRWQSYLIAWDVIGEYPLFGFGIQSAFTVTEQQLFWKKFYSADIGIAGVAFRYGLVGASVYLGGVFYLIVRAIRTNWLIKLNTGECHPIYVAMIVKLSGDIFKYLLSIDYMYIHGLAAAAFLLGTSAVYRRRFAPQPPEPEPRPALNVSSSLKSSA